MFFFRLPAESTKETEAVLEDKQKLEKKIYMLLSGCLY